LQHFDGKFDALHDAAKPAAPVGVGLHRIKWVTVSFIFDPAVYIYIPGSRQPLNNQESWMPGAPVTTSEAVSSRIV